MAAQLTKDLALLGWLSLEDLLTGKELTRYSVGRDRVTIR
jgi:hypothetical protein